MKEFGAKLSLLSKCKSLMRFVCHGVLFCEMCSGWSDGRGWWWANLRCGTSEKIREDMLFKGYVKKVWVED